MLQNCSLITWKHRLRMINLFCYNFRASSGGNCFFISKILSNVLWKETILASDKNGKTFIHHGVESNCLKLITQEV